MLDRKRRFIQMLKKVFCKKAKTLEKNCVFPIKGCIVRCNLGVLLDHSGIYVGNGKIVNLNRNSEIKIEDFKSFFPPGTDPNSNKIYTACLYETNIVLHSKKICNRALKKVNHLSKYNLLFNNCHRFTCGCITGNFENETVSFSMLEDNILKNIEELLPKKNFLFRFFFRIFFKKKKHVNKIIWKPIEF